MADFRTGDEVVVKIPEMRDKVTGQVFPAEEWVGRVKNPNARCMISRIPGMEVSMPDGGTAHIDPAWATPYVKPVRTPLTWDNLYAWAEKQIDEERRSAEAVLVELLISHDAMNVGDYGVSELRETILDFHRNGVVGYVQMERDDLKKECEERFLDPDTCGMDLADLEDLIGALGFEMEPQVVEPKTGEIKIVLSDSQRAAVLEDFVVWSGGFHPRECDIDQIEKYVEHAADASLDENAVEEFLEECRTSPEPRG